MELTDNTVGLFKQDVKQFEQIERLIQETQKAMKPLQSKLKDLM